MQESVIDSEGPALLFLLSPLLIHSYSFFFFSVLLAFLPSCLFIIIAIIHHRHLLLLAFFLADCAGSRPEGFRLGPRVPARWLRVDVRRAGQGHEKLHFSPLPLAHGAAERPHRHAAMIVVVEREYVNMMIICVLPQRID